MDKKFSRLIRSFVFLLATLSISLLFSPAFAAVDEKEPEFLSPDKAFVLSVKAAPNQNEQAKLQFNIAPGYQLYQDHLKFSDLKGQPISEKNLPLPAAIQKQDEVLGQTKIYRKNLEISVPLSMGDNNEFGIKVQYQGCAEAGFCYPPISKKIVVAKSGVISVTDLPPEDFTEKNSASNATIDINNQTGEPQALSEVDRITALFHNRTLPLTLLAFLGIGLLLAFTPCVLPMVPILANILVGQSQPLSRKRSFTLSILYIFSMAGCYAAAGVAAGLLGSHLSTTLQQPLVLISLSFLLMMFSLSQLNLIQVQIPVFLSQVMNKIESKNQSQGSVFGAVSMGAISALVASPCVTPALVGALTYISQTGNALLGGMALFSLAFGMGLPLLIAASIGSHLLPKVGNWMVYIKYVTGALLLVLACSILLRAVPLNTAEASATTQEIAHSSFTNVNSSAELTAAIAKARIENKPVILDVYANWCVSCRQMDKEVFENKTVLNKLNDVQLLRLDLSRQTKDSDALQKELGIIGPPMVIFYWPDGKEAKSYRLAGKPKFSNFVDLVSQFLQETKQKQ
jgi:thiol:disulfide interchange protein DsbD